jgi:hypothetical protein
MNAGKHYNNLLSEKKIFPSLGKLFFSYLN